MTRTPEQRAEFRRIATDFVNKVNAETVCAECGTQPIEWHGEHHPAQPNARISSLRTQGASIERIQYEMTLCVPLCRFHHMTVDGRLDALHAAAPQKKGEIYVPPAPCSECRKVVKPLRKGKCQSCYVKSLPFRACEVCTKEVRLLRKGKCSICYRINKRS